MTEVHEAMWQLIGHHAASRGIWLDQLLRVMGWNPLYAQAFWARGPAIALVLERHREGASTATFGTLTIGAEQFPIDDWFQREPTRTG